MEKRNKTKRGGLGCFPGEAVKSLSVLKIINNYKNKKYKYIYLWKNMEICNLVL